MPGKINLTVRIPPEVDEAINEEAKRQDRSKAWITIKALKDYLSKKESEK